MIIGKRVSFIWDNPYTPGREEVLGTVLEVHPGRVFTLLVVRWLCNGVVYTGFTHGCRITGIEE